nr:MAG TPA: hypothetical protein [Caudoviricetes sp.]
MPQYKTIEIQGKPVSKEQAILSQVCLHILKLK